MESPEPSYRDPYDWSVDEVIEQFCHNQRPLWANEVKLSRALNFTKALEIALRDNDIDGVNLFELTDVSLKHDLGLTSFGQRGHLLRIINFLRQSSKTLERDRFQSEAINRLNDSHPQFTPQTTSTYQQHRNSNTQHGIIYGGGPIQLPQFARSSHIGQQQYVDQQSNKSIIIDPSERSANLNGFSSQTSHPPFRNTDGFLSSNPRRSPSLARHQMKENQDKITAASSILPLPYLEGQKEQLEYGTNGARAATSGLGISTANSTPTNHTRIASEANASTQKASPAKQDNEFHHKAKKRIAPTFIGVVSEGSLRLATVPEAAKKDLDQTIGPTGTYLGRDAVHVEDIFFPIGFDDSTMLNVSNSHHPSGLRQVIGSSLRDFFRQPVRTRNDTNFNYRLRQRPSRQSRSSVQYCSVYQPIGSPTIEAVSSYSDTDNIHKNRYRKDVILLEHGTPESDPFLVSEWFGQDDADQFDDLLQKYPVDDDSDDVLPLFGESDGEIDYETWEEVQKEIAEKQQIRPSRQISRADVVSAINTVIIEQQLRWSNTSASKMDRKAYRAWQTSVRQNSTEKDIAAHNFWITKLDQRIEKLRQAILKDVWYRVEDVKKQCESLEQSVIQREEHKHLISVLRDDEPPARPLPTDRSHTVKVIPKDLGSDEEDLGSDSDASMGDFIANDAMESSDIESIPHGGRELKVEHFIESRAKLTWPHISYAAQEFARPYPSFSWVDQTSSKMPL